MGLTERKRINNIPHYNLGKFFKLPGSDEYGDIAVGGLNFALQADNSFGGVKSAGDIMAESGTSVGYGPGFTFQRQNQADTEALMKELEQLNKSNIFKDAAAGMLLGKPFGLGGVVGGGIVGGIVGLIGGASRKRKMQELLMNSFLLTNRNNDYSLASAHTDYLTGDYNLKHGNTQNNKLYGAKNGLEPNAMVSNGEIIGHVDEFGNVTDAVRVGHGKDNKDTIPVRLADGKAPNLQPSPNSFVISNKYGLSDYADATGDYLGALRLQSGIRDYETMATLANKHSNYNSWNRLVPKYVGGKEFGNVKKKEDETLNDYLIRSFNDRTSNDALQENTIKTPTIESPAKIITDNYKNSSAAALRKFDVLAMGLELGSELDKFRYPDISLKSTKTDGGEKPAKGMWTSGIDNALATLFGLATAYGLRPKGSLSRPNVNTSNGHERLVLDTLWGMRANGTLRIQAAKDTYANTMYNINRMGGLSGALKYLAAVSSGIGLLKNIASILADIDRENNGYKTQAANMAAQLGGQSADRLQRALIHDYDAYSKAHGAAVQLANMSSLNALAQIQQYLKNNRRLNEFERTMAYYDLDYQLRKDALNRGWGIV